MSETDIGGGLGLGGARCALHPDQPATRTCTRCGSFMCSTCSEGGAQTLCPSCQQRLGVDQVFPLTRENWTFSSLWDYCFEIFKREWLTLGLGVLIFVGSSLVVQLVGSALPAIGNATGSQALSVLLTFVSMLLQQVVQGVLGLGLMRMTFDTLQGKKADVGRVFSQIHKIGPFLGVILIIFLALIIPLGGIGALAYVTFSNTDSERMLPVLGGVALVAIFPLIYYTLPLYLLQADIAFTDDPKPMQALRNCYRYARGERLSILGVGLVGALVSLVGILACCVGVLPAMGLNYLLLAGLYLALRTGESVPD
jgi:hypothetical protein